MPTLYHLQRHFHKHGSSRKLLYTFSSVIFFWTLYDGIVSYLTPLLITRAGFSTTTMGIIIGTSSLWGALFDILFAKVITNPHYRRMFLLVFALSALYPLLLMKATTVWLFLLAMMVWGLYYDLFHFGLFDFVSRVTAKEEHASSFGVLEVFKSLGYLIAPLLATLTATAIIGWQPFFLMWILLGTAFMLFVVLMRKTSRGTKEFIHASGTAHVHRSLWVEFGIWRTIGKPLLPVLLLTFFLFVIDAAFWTIGPLFAEELQSLHPFGGLLVSAYMFPPLLVGWFVGSITSRFGKKKTAFVALATGSLILLFVSIVTHPALVVVTVFLASFFLAFSWPAINGAYADYIEETPLAEKEIEGIQDFFLNAGYIVGPIFAGIVADEIGAQLVFAVLGGVGILVAILLLAITPKHISLGKSLNSMKP